MSPRRVDWVRRREEAYKIAAWSCQWNGRSRASPAVLLRVVHQGANVVRHSTVAVAGRVCGHLHRDYQKAVVIVA